jgi:HD-GYP domain-containing protein (c-di-GMP phosphodiesterase class II)
VSEDRLDGLLSLADVAGEAPLGDPDEEGLSELRDLGKALTNGLFQSMRILSIHSSDNEAVREPLRRLVRTLTALFEHSSAVHFITVEGQIYLNDLRIKMEASAYSNVVYLVSQLDRHGIGGITFSRVPSEGQLKQLVMLLLTTKPPKDPDLDPLDHVRAALIAAELPGVTLDRPYFFKAGEASGLTQDSEEAQQEVAALSYAKGVLAVKDYFRAVEAAEAANPLRIRKIVHDLVDVSEDEPDNFLKLHTIHGVEDAYYNHCVNVATLAVTIGRLLGLTRVELADLGAAAMFHDLGYAAIERQEREENREFSPPDRMRLHTVAGFRSLLKQAEYGPGLLRRLLVTLEHHMTWKRPGGYPSLGRKRLSVFTRIVAVADHYDALVTPAAGAPGLLPVKAIERLVAGSGTQFDPIVVRALVQLVGRYPYGSLVRLTSGEVGVVTSGGRDERRFARPTVMIVRSGDGTPIQPHQVDLAENDILRRRISEVLDPHDADLTPHAVLFDQLDPKEAVEAPTASTSFDSEEWNRAIWEGEDVEELITGSMQAVPDPDDDRPVEGTTVERLRAVSVDPEPAPSPEPESDVAPAREPLEPADPEDVLAWLDAAIEASQPSMPSIQAVHIDAAALRRETAPSDPPPAGSDAPDFGFGFGDPDGDALGAAEAELFAGVDPFATDAEPFAGVDPFATDAELFAGVDPFATDAEPFAGVDPFAAAPPIEPSVEFTFDVGDDDDDTDEEPVGPSARLVAPAPPAPARPRGAAPPPSPAPGSRARMAAPPPVGVVRPRPAPPPPAAPPSPPPAPARTVPAAEAPPASEAERNRLIGEAFAEGGEAAVLALMERWGQGL